jgi:hypothetical protein
LPVVTVHSTSIRTETTIDREYRLVLMQDLVNGGQVPTQDSFLVLRGGGRVAWSADDGKLNPGRRRIGLGAPVPASISTADGGPARHHSRNREDAWRHFGQMAPALKGHQAV